MYAAKTHVDHTHSNRPHTLWLTRPCTPFHTHTHTAIAQWFKIRNLPSVQHLARWYNHCARQPTLAAIADQYNPKRKAAPSNAANAKGDLSESLAVFGMGGGGMCCVEGEGGAWC